MEWRAGIMWLVGYRYRTKLHYTSPGFGCGRLVRYGFGLVRRPFSHHSTTVRTKTLRAEQIKISSRAS
jgi:hypothetical protein